MGDIVESDTLFGDVLAGGSNQVLVVSADNNGGDAGSVGKDGIVTDATNAKSGFIVPG